MVMSPAPSTVTCTPQAGICTHDMRAYGTCTAHCCTAVLLYCLLTHQVRVGHDHRQPAASRLLLLRALLQKLLQLLQAHVPGAAARQSKCLSAMGQDEISLCWIVLNLVPQQQQSALCLHGLTLAGWQHQNQSNSAAHHSNKAAVISAVVSIQKVVFV